MIRVENLSKNFVIKVKGRSLLREKRTVRAVKNVTMEIEKGQIVGLLGVNGAGKTTTIKMLSTLLEPTEGTYEFDGIDAVSHPMEVKQKINMIAGGERMLYWRLTARELPRGARAQRPRAAARKRRRLHRAHPSR